MIENLVTLDMAYACVVSIIVICTLVSLKQCNEVDHSYKCKAQERDSYIFEEGCNCIPYKGRMCKGLCKSHEMPAIKSSRKKNKTQTGKKILLNDTENSFPCSACLPTEFEKRKVHCSCQRKIERPIFDIEEYFFPPTESYQKTVEMDIIKHCACAKKTCGN